MNLLVNGNFSDTRTHEIPGASGSAPFGWSGWYKYLPGRRKVPWDLSNDTGYVAPEWKPTKAVPPYLDPPRHVNGFGWCWFGQGKVLWSGLWQRVSVPVGVNLRFNVKVHGWSNTLQGPNRDNPFWSDGVGKGVFFKLADTQWPNIGLTGDPNQDAIPNMAFDIGIDPTGGIDPFSTAIVWGSAAHVYNIFAALPEVEAVSADNVITVYLRSRSLWGFWHNDTYWAEATLTADVPEIVDYVVVVNLLPQDATKPEKAQVLDMVHESKETILQSADDAKRLVQPGKPGSRIRVWGGDRWGSKGAIASYLSPCAVYFEEF
jgi:hypothetical protein